MKGRIVKALFKDMYPVYMNGIAIVGWFVAAVYGLLVIDITLNCTLYNSLLLGRYFPLLNRGT